VRIDVRWCTDVQRVAQQIRCAAVMAAQLAQRSGAQVRRMICIIARIYEFNK
jgi:methyl-accepting chemotaxis protein